MSGLTALSLLFLGTNSITEIDALSGLRNLTWVYLSANAGLSNIHPLLDNTDFCCGDRVELRVTGVTCGDVAALRAKGVVVVSDC